MSIDETKTFVPLNIAVLTVSDTRSLADDKSGTTLAERLVAAGHTLAAREIIVDDVDAIRVIVKRWIADPGIDVIITTGGTGLTGRDVTPEAIEPLFEKDMDGFSIAFHMLQPRQDRHLDDPEPRHRRRRRRHLLFALPGSPGACRMAGTASGSAARLPHAAVQFCRDHAAAGRAPAASESARRVGVNYPRHSGTRPFGAGPKSIIPIGGYRFRARPLRDSPRNDECRFTPPRLAQRRRTILFSNPHSARHISRQASSRRCLARCLWNAKRSGVMRRGMSRRIPVTARAPRSRRQGSGRNCGAARSRPARSLCPDRSCGRRPECSGSTA